MSYLQQQRVLHSADKRYPSPVCTWWHAPSAILYKTIFLPENNLPLLLLDQIPVDPKTRPIKRSRQAECLWWDGQLLSDQLCQRECLFSDGIVRVSGSIRAADIKRLHWTWTTFGLLSLNLALIWDKPGIKITFSTPLICLWLCFHHYSNKLMYRRPSSLVPCLWIQSILKRYRFSIYVVRYLNTLVLFLDCGSCLRCVPD